MRNTITDDDIHYWQDKIELVDIKIIFLQGYEPDWLIAQHWGIELQEEKAMYLNLLERDVKLRAQQQTGIFRFLHKEGRIND